MTLSPAGASPAGGAPVAAVFTLEHVQQYIWARYVDHEPPAVVLDEDEALNWLADHYASTSLAADPDAYYLGILAFERSFAAPAQQHSLLQRALEAFQAYRANPNTDSAWEAVDDRYSDTLQLLGLDPESAL